MGSKKSTWVLTAVVALIIVRLGVFFWSRSHPSPPPRLMPESLFVVAFDDTAITVTEPNKEKRSVSWASLTKVVIRTTDEGPLNPDVFWDFYDGGEKPVAIFPGGATGESQLLEAMQSRLPGFNNGEVIKAMTSIENAHFVIWEPVASGQE